MKPFTVRVPEGAGFELDVLDADGRAVEVIQPGQKRDFYKSGVVALQRRVQRFRFVGALAAMEAGKEVRRGDGKDRFRLRNGQIEMATTTGWKEVSFDGGDLTAEDWEIAT